VVDLVAASPYTGRAAAQRNPAQAQIAMTISDPIPELSRVVTLNDPDDAEPFELRIDATEEQRAALGKRMELIDIPALSAEIAVVRLGLRRVRVHVKYRADVIQSCVVTLEPVPVTIEESFTQEFLCETEKVNHSTAADRGEVWVEPNDEVEILESDHLDVGELLVQYLSLALDPYPRKEGTSFAGFKTDEGAPNPAFAALGEIKREAARKRS